MGLRRSSSQLPVGLWVGSISWPCLSFPACKMHCQQSKRGTAALWQYLLLQGLIPGIMEPKSPSRAFIIIIIKASLSATTCLLYPVKHASYPICAPWMPFLG